LVFVAEDNVEVIVAIKVADCDRHSPLARTAWQDGPQLKSPVTLPKEQLVCLHPVGNDDVQIPVAVHVAERHAVSFPAPARQVGRLIRKATALIGLAEQELVGFVIAPVTVANDQIERPVAIHVAERHRLSTPAPKL